MQFVKVFDPAYVFSFGAEDRVGGRDFGARSDAPFRPPCDWLAQAGNMAALFTFRSTCDVGVCKVNNVIAC